MDDPLVSVVTPVYNTDEHLDTCIQSIRSQSYENWDYVVFDNLSTDASAEIAERHASEDPRIRLVRSDRHRPQLENYNRALEEVPPDATYVTLAQADDWLFEDCLERLVGTARAGDDVGLVGCYRVMGDEVVGQGLPFEGRRNDGHHSLVPGRVPCRLWLLDNKNVIGSPTGTLYRKEIVDRLEPLFIPDSYPLADAEVAFRSLHEFDFGFVHQVLAFIRPVGDGSISRKVWRTYAPEMLNRVFLLEKYGDRYLTADELDRGRSRVWSDYRADLAKSVLLRAGDDEFWSYHRRRLAIIDEKITWETFVRGFWRMFTEWASSWLRKMSSPLSGTGM